MKNESIAFSDALNETLGTPKRIEMTVVPASFANLQKTTFGSSKTFDSASRSGKDAKIEALKQAYSNTDGIGTNKDFGIRIVPSDSENPNDLATVQFDMSDVNNVIETMKTPTREAYSGALESLARLEEQSIVSNALAIRVRKEMKHKTNPNHYAKKKPKREKLSKPAKFFGNSKDIIYVRVKGEVKAMSMKNAKKFGHI